MNYVLLIHRKDGPSEYRSKTGGLTSSPYDADIMDIFRARYEEQWIEDGGGSVTIKEVHDIKAFRESPATNE